LSVIDRVLVVESKTKEILLPPADCRKPTH
jgi:hypothetical protein